MVPMAVSGKENGDEAKTLISLLTHQKTCSRSFGGLIHKTHKTTKGYTAQTAKKLAVNACQAGNYSPEPITSAASPAGDVALYVISIAGQAIN